MKIELTYNETRGKNQKTKVFEGNRQTIRDEVLNFYFSNGSIVVKKMLCEGHPIEFLKEGKDDFFPYEEHQLYLDIQIKDCEHYRYDYSGAYTGRVINDSYIKSDEELEEDFQKVVE